MPTLPDQIRVKGVLRGSIAVVLVALAPLQLACGDSDDGSAKEIREVEIQSLAAYACMPADLRRRLRQLERRHDARIRALARASIPKGATGGVTPPPNFQQTVEADPVRGGLLRTARGIYRRYSPGGRDYDPNCYLREREKARNRLENTGAGTTGS
jgi:hypothetical protein